MNYTSVAFDDTVKNWSEFANELNELPADTGIAFDVSEPLGHHFFCKFIHMIQRPWTLRTTLFGPGYHCLRANPHTLLIYCQEIIGIFPDDGRAGFYEWLRKLALLARVGYNVRAITTFVPKDDFVQNVTHGLVSFPIEVIDPPTVEANHV